MSEIFNRPWGNFVILDEAENYKVKRLVIKPGQETSVQYHKLRSEHWVIVKGVLTNKFYVSDTPEILPDVTEPKIYLPGHSLEIKPNQIHQIINAGDEDLVIIETQFGKCDENDIVRLQDKYGRARKL